MLSPEQDEWRQRAEKAESELAKLRANRTEILESAWYRANERAKSAEKELELWHSSCHKLEDERDELEKMLKFAFYESVGVALFSDVDAAYTRWRTALRELVQDGF